jgi:hypothetical protein
LTNFERLFDADLDFAIDKVQFQNARCVMRVTDEGVEKVQCQSGGLADDLCIEFKHPMAESPQNNNIIILKGHQDANREHFEATSFVQ